MLHSKVEPDALAEAEKSVILIKTLHGQIKHKKET